jgi:serine/threonine-protein kinase
MTTPDFVAQLTGALADRYDIEREVGRGGMATVYLARDLRHHRQVAIKVLDPELGAVLGAERFLSEIRVTANLQHPNLLPLFDSGEAAGLLFYVMPFVRGESLRARIEREKQLPVDEAVSLATALCSALDYAHRQGVIHRDLKPENVLLHDGQPLIADFGIALAVSNAGGQRVTQTGLSLGTPQYMSPEQATGDRNIDGRTDIYSLGAVTYEMLAGEPPHSGTTAQAIIARLMTEEPRSITSTRRAVPEQVDAAVRCALEKLPADRFQTAKEFADALQGRGAASSATRGTRAMPGAARSGKRRQWVVAAGIGVISAALGAVAASILRTADDASPAAHFTFDAPAGVTLTLQGTAVAFSPDGRRVVFSGSTKEGLQLYSRAVDDLVAKPIPGTKDGMQPVFSPDGRWIAFFARGTLKKVEADGGVAVTVSPLRALNGVDWTVDDVIVSGAHGTFRGLTRVSADGGEVVEFTKPDSAKGVAQHLWPVALPDGKTILFTLYDGKSIDGSRLAMTSLEDGEVHALGVTGVAPLGVVDGQLVYVRSDGTIMAAPFEGRAKRVSGASVAVLDPIYVCPGCNGDAAVGLSNNGSLVAMRGVADRARLVIISRNGAERDVGRDERAFTRPKFSPDGRRLAVSIRGVDTAANHDVWIYDVQTGSPTRLTSGRDNIEAGWSPDGRRILLTSGDHKGPLQVWEQMADGSAAASRINDAPLGFWPTLSPDGRSLVFGVVTGELHSVVIGSGATPTPFAKDGLSRSPSFSPDGKWIAYSANESGRFETYVRPFPGPGGRIQLSANGGELPRWIEAGRRVVYVTADNTLEVATVTTSPAFSVVSRAPFFEGANVTVDVRNGLDVSPDGSRVAVIRPSGEPIRVLVVLNWVQELRERRGRPR